MENNIPNENLVSYNGSSMKPYERKIKVNAKMKKNNEKEANKIISKSYNELEPNDQKIKEIEIKGNFYDNNSQYDESNKIIYTNNLEEEIKPSISNNAEENLIYIHEENDIQNTNDNNEYENNENRYQYEEEEEKEENEQENNKNNYKKIKINKNILKQEQEIENEEEEINEEEDEKEETDNFDYQELKKKPGKLLHFSKNETFDEEGNRIITTKTIKEYKDMKPGVKIRNIQDEKQKIYERYTENIGRKFVKTEDNRKTHITNKSDNIGDRFYLLAQLAKLKNDAEKRKIQQSKNYYAQSPLYYHQNNEYEVYENQNSVLSNEIIEPNSFDEQMCERTYNYHPINRSRDRYYIPGQYMRYSGVNEMENEYFNQNAQSQNQEILSPIGYIATYSSGSEDNEEMGKSYDHIRNVEKYKNKNDKKIYKKEGELIKKSEVIYQMEDPNDYIGFNEKRKNKNLSTMIVNTQNDIIKSDKKDFQSPDRGTGTGSDKFRRVTMAMISSLGPTCEDRKITRKMRSEIGGVVDLRQDLSPLNTYKIKKFQRKGYNLNKEVNPKTKLEGARIIQAWWRNLKDKKLYMITYIKIVKIQSTIRTFLMKKRIIRTKIIYYIYETMDNIINNNNKKNLSKIFEYYKKDKEKRKLKNLINKLDRKNKKQQLLKYFYKYRYIIDFINNQDKKESSLEEKDKTILIRNANENKITETIKETKIIEEIYNNIREKNIVNNKLEHVTELTVDKIKKKPYEITNKTKYEISRINKELVDKQTQDEYEKKEYKDTGIQQEEDKKDISKNEKISYVNQIQKQENISVSQNKTNKKSILDNKQIINKDKISFIYNKPLTKEEGVEGGTININQISENKSILFIKPKIEKKDLKKDQNIKLDKKIEISINSQKKELIESSTQKDKEENKINTLNQLSIINQKPKTNEQGTGNFTIKEGIDSENFNILKNKKEYKDSETEPVKKDLELSKNNLSIIADKKGDIEIKIKMEEKISKIIAIQKNEKLKNILENFLKKYLKSNFEKFVMLYRKKKMIIEPIKYDDFKFLYQRPQNLKVKLEEFLIQRKEKPELQIDKKEDYNILKVKKIYKDEESQEKPDLIENGVNPETIQNQIIKNEMINIENNKKDTTEIGTNPTTVENKIINTTSININKNPKELKDTETTMEIIPQKICSNDNFDIIKPKKELKDDSIQYIEPQKYTSYEEILTIIIKKKINKDNLNLRKYFTRWNQTVKKELFNNNANKIIKNVKGYLVRNKIKNNENKKDALKKIIDIYDKSTNKYLKKIWTQFKHNCTIITKPIEINQGDYFSIIYIKPENKKEKIEEIFISSKEKTPLEINKIQKLDIIGKLKDLKELGIQKTPDIKDEGTQNEIPKNKISKKVNQLNILVSKKEKKDEYTQNESYKPKITKNKLNLICKIDKKEEGQQIGGGINTIKKNESFNLIAKKPKKEEKKVVNEIQDIITLEINKKEKEMKEQGMQYIPIENKIQKQQIQINSNKPKMKDDYSQYIGVKPVISRQNEYRILMGNKKELIKRFKILQNSMSILSTQKDLSEKGEQCDISKKHKSIEVILGNKIKRGGTRKLMDILEKILVKKQKTKFIYQFKQAYKNNIIKREILRMYLLKWRFIEGYGGNEYGIIYDRNGKQIGKKEGTKSDVSIQNNLYEEIENSKLRAKKQQIKVCKQKPIYIKSNIIQKKTIMINKGTGEGPNHTLSSNIYKAGSVSYLRKLKSANILKISNKNNFKINNTKKIVKNESTDMPRESYKISKVNKLSFRGNDKLLTNEEYIEYRRRDLLTHFISKTTLRQKYILNDYFSKWFQKTMRIIHSEYNEKLFKKISSRISKNEKFEIIQRKKAKIDKSVGNIYTPNKIVRGSKMEYKNNLAKKDEGILVNMPNIFKKENLWTRKINNDIYKSYKKPKILRQIRGDSQTFYGNKNQKYELDKPIGQKEILDEINIRITEIFVKFVKTRNSPKYILRKYLSIWYRNSQYMALYKNAKIIGEFCRKKFNLIIVRKRWRKLYSKYLFVSKQYKIMSIIRKIRQKRYKLIKLLRLTKLITLFNKRKYLHYILMSWFIYTISNIKKRNQMKLIYQNMLTTYVSMADDIFGNNQKNNPSIQDCMFEIIDTNKFQVKELEDVPIAKIYYSKKKGEKKFYTNMKYIQKEINEEKEYSFYKTMNKKYYTSKNNYEQPKDYINKTEKPDKTHKKIFDNKDINSKYKISQGEDRYGKRRIINKEKIENIINNQTINVNNESENIYDRRNNTYKSTSLDTSKTHKNESKNEKNTINNSETTIKYNNINRENGNASDSKYKRRKINNIETSSSQSEAFFKRRNNKGYEIPTENNNAKECEVKYGRRNNEYRVKTTDIKDKRVISEATYKRRNNTCKGNNQKETENNNYTDRLKSPQKTEENNIEIKNSNFQGRYNRRKYRNNIINSANEKNNNNDNNQIKTDQSSPNLNINKYCYKTPTEGKPFYSKKNYYANKYDKENKK